MSESYLNQVKCSIIFHTVLHCSLLRLFTVVLFGLLFDFLWLPFSHLAERHNWGSEKSAKEITYSSLWMSDIVGSLWGIISTPILHKMNRKRRKGREKGTKKGVANRNVHSRLFSLLFHPLFFSILRKITCRTVFFLVSYPFCMSKWKREKKSGKKTREYQKGEKRNWKRSEKRLLWTTLLTLTDSFWLVLTHSLGHDAGLTQFQHEGGSIEGGHFGRSRTPVPPTCSRRHQISISRISTWFIWNERMNQHIYDASPSPSLRTLHTPFNARYSILVTEYFYRRSALKPSWISVDHPGWMLNLVHTTLGSGSTPLGDMIQIADLLPPPTFAAKTL